VPSTIVIVPPCLPPDGPLAAPLELAPDDDALLLLLELLEPLDPQAAIASAATAISSVTAADLTYLFT
jgi:hypothetical protein